MLEELEPLVSAHFFAFQADCHHVRGKTLDKAHLLPDTCAFHGLKSFTKVSAGWNREGLLFHFAIEGAFDQPDFPNFQASDSIELMIDTRDVKTTAYTTRFCHHFYFLPQPVKNNGDVVQAGEITRFRTEDAHELCDATLLKVSKKLGMIEIFIPRECLHGYDPSQFNRLGFTYRINRVDGRRQFFSANDEDFSIEKLPSLWATLNLIKD